MVSKRSMERDSANESIPKRRSGRASTAPTHADGSSRQSYKQTEGIVPSKPESTVETLPVAGRPSRSKKIPLHHDGTKFTVSVSNKEGGARARATGFLRVAADAAKKKASKKVEDAKAAAKAKKKRAGVEAEKQKRVSAAAAAAKEKLEELKRVAAAADDAAAAAAAKEKEEEEEEEGLKRVAAETTEGKKDDAKADEEESKVEGDSAAAVAAVAAAAAAVAAAAAANRKKIDDLFKNGRLKIGSKIDVYTDRSQFIARTCVLKSVDEEGRTAHVLYDDGEENELVTLDLMQKDFDISLFEKDGDSLLDWAMDNNTVDGTSAQSAQLAMLKNLQERMEAMSQKMDIPNPSKERKRTEPKRAVGTRAESVPQMKDEVVRRMYDVLAKYSEQIQFNSQFKSQADRDYHPPFWTLLMNVDKLVPNPSAKGLGSRYEKAKPVVNMFAQKGIPVLELARILRNAAENMEKGITEGWTLESETEKFLTNTFGPRSNGIPAKQKSMVAAMQLEQEELEQIEKAVAATTTAATAAAASNYREV
jgi:hypothetical protein